MTGMEDDYAYDLYLYTQKNKCEEDIMYVFAEGMIYHGLKVGTII